MTLLPGIHPGDISQGAATRSLLRALCMSPEAAFIAAGVDLGPLLEGRAHVPAWPALAERLVVAAGQDRDQTPPRELTPTPKEMRQALGARRR